MRAILPRFMNNQEVVVIQYQCDPRTVDEKQFKLHFALLDVMQKYDLQLGQSFDIQFVNEARTELIALQRYVVTVMREEIVRSDVSHYQTIQRNVFRRTCQPTSDLIFFTEMEEVSEDVEDSKPKGEVNGDKKKKRPRLSDVISPSEVITPNYAGMSLPQLQKLCKEKLGHGFGTGAKADTMIQALEEHDKEYAAQAR